MIVVDTNIIAYFLIEGERTPQARALWRHDPQWHLPSLWRHEFLNILSTYARAGGMALSDARGLWQSAVRLCHPMESSVEMDSALALSVEKGISAYDAQFVVLADTMDVPVVSEDKALRRRCPNSVVTMKECLQA